MYCQYTYNMVGVIKVKTEVLRMLKETDDYLSGQEICERLNVSRTAVWKVIKQLEAEGYEIEAVRNRGYRLRFLGDVLSQAELESSIDSEWAGKNILYFDETDSTNTEIKKAAEKDAPHGTLAVADYQSMGKGRRGRSWAAPHGVGIWMSLLLRPELPPTCASMLTLVAALAEPNWVSKVQNGEEEILRKCISCNVGCAGNRIGVNRPIRCTVNPAVPEGDIYKKLKVNKNCNVVVVGGGTAGLEAACTAAEVGCNVFLLEKSGKLGGLSTFISDLPSKNRMKDFPKYLEARAKRLKNLYVFLNCEATVDKIKQFKPDIIVNATGSVPVVPPIKGLKENIAAGHVDTIFEMIQKVKAGEYPDDFCKGKKVVVVGGGSVGLDVVEYFAPRGAECTIVDMLPQIGMLADPITKCSMRETHDKYGVKEYVNTALQEVKENAFTVKLPDGTIEDLNFDLGFNCLGMRANNPILVQLEEAFDNTDTFIYPIGDSVRARRIMEGTMEGRAILNVLEARGFLELAPLE